MFGGLEKVIGKDVIAASNTMQGWGLMSTDSAHVEIAPVSSVAIR